MASVNQQKTRSTPIGVLSPRQAARRREPVDGLLRAEVFKALGDPTRLNLFACLVKCGRACSVTEVAECCDVDFSVVSRHLAILADAGVLRSRKVGRTVWYEAAGDELVDWLRSLADAIEESCCAADGCCGIGAGNTGCCGTQSLRTSKVVGRGRRVGER